jgi:hypothetical protein
VKKKGTGLEQMEGCAEGDPGSKRAVAPLLLLMMMKKTKKMSSNRNYYFQTIAEV